MRLCKGYYAMGYYAARPRTNKLPSARELGVYHLGGLRFSAQRRERAWTRLGYVLE